MKIANTILVSLVVYCCASVAVAEVATNVLEDRTAFTLGLKKEDFTISARQDSGVRTDYQVQAKSGAQYNCYVTSGFSITGRIVSDAICSQLNATESPDKKATASNPSCNALLKAANKC